jgi:hypothetical protein
MAKKFLLVILAQLCLSAAALETPLAAAAGSLAVQNYPQTRWPELAQDEIRQLGNVVGVPRRSDTQYSGLQPTQWRSLLVLRFELLDRELFDRQRLTWRTIQVVTGVHRVLAYLRTDPHASQQLQTHCQPTSKRPRR